MIIYNRVGMNQYKKAAFKGSFFVLIQIENL